MTTSGYFLTPNDFRELEQITERLAYFASIIFDQAIDFDEMIRSDTEAVTSNPDLTIQLDTL